MVYYDLFLHNFNRENLSKLFASYHLEYAILIPYSSSSFWLQAIYFKVAINPSIKRMMSKFVYVKHNKLSYNKEITTVTIIASRLMSRRV